TKRTMYPHQYYILFNLRKIFTLLISDKKITGSLEAEIDLFLTEKIHRRPDITYFTDEQAILMAHGELPTPKFVIEVVSSNDVLPRQNLKMKNYRDAGIQVIWQIFPETKEVIITRGKDAVTCTGDDICSAAPVLPDFKISVKDIFQKPPKPVKKT
ncbi:MAG: Uma2 family endonuclease, partial [Saprospiraceae bacterium]